MKKSGTENDGRDNVVLLIVIAIVTMIVVVVGATFAYLASAVQSNSISNINAQTNGGTDILLFNAGSDIDLVANMENFGLGSENITGDIDASVVLQTATDAAVDYKYKVYMEIPANNFVYTSGTCYEKGLSTVAEGTDLSTCKSNNATNVWATTNGTDYACYAAPTAINDSRYTNRVTCLSNAKYMWANTEVAEIVVDLYQNDPDKTASDTCQAVGVCVDKLRNVVSGHNTEGTCDAAAGETWLKGIYADDMCYVPVAHKDITEVQTESGDKVVLLSEKTITAGEDVYEAKHYYKAVFTLINLGHNQLVNTNKSMNASLIFERIVAD